MCGIAGFVDFSGGHSSEWLTDLALRMARAMRHRGPDDEGVWSDAPSGVALAMRRLAVVDPSPAGHQPMHSESGRYVLVVNGEIYNCEELREELSASITGARFRGHSDTEVMLAAFECWGIHEALQRFNGMFAFALWDCDERVLHLAIDRFGEKPLYFSRTGTGIIFGSELKALRLHPEFDDTLDRGAIALFLRHNCIPGPHTVYKHTAKLVPGTLLSLNECTLHDVTPTAYWSAAETARLALAQPFTGNEDDAAEQLNALLLDSVRIRMRSDVPVGAFLSGGVDSSAIVALMQSLSARPVRTFSIGVHETDYNEAPEAAEVAKHLGTNHTDLYVTPAEAMAVIPRLAAMYDEPFADSSQIPTHLLAQLARQHVTVCLSGDGGDELFGGYNRHVWSNRLMRLPRPLRTFASRTLGTVPADWCDAVFRRAPAKWRLRMPGYKMHKLAAALACADARSLHRTLTTHWRGAGSLALHAHECQAQPVPEAEALNFSTAERLMLLDTITYLPDDILVKLDRATMAAGLEARTPFLDPRVFEFAWRLPLMMRVRSGTGKVLLRKLLHRYVPPALIDRPKTGFGIPLDSWLSGPLRDWCEALLDERRLCREGIFNPAPIRAKWAEYLAGRRCWTWHLWDVLMFQAWMEECRATSTPPMPCCVMPRP